MSLIFYWFPVCWGLYVYVCVCWNNHLNSIWGQNLFPVTLRGLITNAAPSTLGSCSRLMGSATWTGIIMVKGEVSRKAKLSFQSIYDPTLTYGHDFWVMTKGKKLCKRLKLVWSRTSGERRCSFTSKGGWFWESDQDHSWVSSFRDFSRQAQLAGDPGADPQLAGGII